MSSTRLPGKVLMPILGEPMILHQLQRLSRSTKIQKIVVATSTDESDDVLANLLTTNGHEVHRGPLKDVLTRYAEVVSSTTAENYVRITADCPLIDHEIVDSVIESHLVNGSDYTSNTLSRTFPRGLDTEVFSRSAIERLQNFELSESEREHVTQGIYSRPDMFSLQGIEQEPSYGHLRWTVDTKEDFLFVESVYQALYQENDLFLQADVLNLLQERPMMTHLEPLDHAT